MRLRYRLKKYKTIILYGAGGIGKQVGAWLERENFCNFIYAVTTTNSDTSENDDLNVRIISDLVERKDDAVVLLSTLPNLHEEMKQNAKNLGFKNIIAVDEKFLREIGLFQVNGVFLKKHAMAYAFLDSCLKRIWRNSRCKNQLLFYSRIDYSDSARALYEYIEKTYPGKYKSAWVVGNPEKYRGNNKTHWLNRTEPTLKDIFFLAYYQTHAKFIFMTSYGWFSESHSGQTIIQLGHGNPFKKAGFKQGGEDRKNWHADYVLASGDDGVKFRWKEYGDAAKNIIVLGPPRNDWLFSGSKYIEAYTDGKLYRKIVLCLPTYKQYDASLGMVRKTIIDSREKNNYCISTIENDDELDALNKYLEKNNILIICKDHFVQNKNEYASRSNIKYIDTEILQNNGHDMMHLLAGADALLTDFSSVFMDYLLLDRPVGFFINHKAEYDRGFIVDVIEDYMPGAKIKTNEDLRAFFEDLINENDNYATERTAVTNKIFKYQDDQNCRRCAEFFGL